MVNGTGLYQDRNKQRALIFQGGGALGAYEAGISKRGFRQNQQFLFVNPV